VPLVVVLVHRVTEEGSPELRRRATPPCRAARRPHRVLAGRAVPDVFVVSRASSRCDPHTKPSPLARSHVAPPPLDAVLRRSPLDQDLTVLINLTAAACAAATAGRWIKIQRAGLDPTRVNTGQTGLTLPFCKKVPMCPSFTNRSFRRS
jgi:hypothetical protein